MLEKLEFASLKFVLWKFSNNLALIFDQVVAVKQLDRNGCQGNREFLVEVLMLSLLHHKNLVNLIGYCADGDQRLLVYEYMPLGSLEDHLIGTIDICFFLFSSWREVTQYLLSKISSHRGNCILEIVLLGKIINGRKKHQ